MSLGTLAAAVDFIAREGLAGPGTTVVWHAGEPLTVPVSWYRDAAAVLAAGWPHGRPRQSLQTNATLINDEWCRFFRDHSVSVGVSLDGRNNP